MIKGFINDALLKARMKAGFSGAVAAWLAIAVISTSLTFFFLAVAAFAWLADRYDPVVAGLIMAGFFLLLSILAALLAVVMRRKAREEARAQLLLAAAARKHSAASTLFDPRMLAVGLQLFNAAGGLRRIVPLAAAGILAATIGREWARFGSSDPDPRA